MPHPRFTTLTLNDTRRLRFAPRRHKLLARAWAPIFVRVVFVVIVGALIYSAVASAAELPIRAWQSLQSIRDAAEHYVRDEVVNSSRGNAVKPIIVAGELDARLQLAACATPLRAFMLNSAALAAHNTIAVRCMNEAAGPLWTIYVPISLEVEKEVYVLRRSLPRDAHVTADDVELQSRRVAGLGDMYIGDPNTLREEHLKRSLPLGALLTVDTLTRDLMIKRGQEVFLVFGDSGLAVRAPGIALADGGAADRIRVQNRTSLKVVEGTIESGNLVRVGL
jgi:flagella basal body P-ring formation protein FlgA